MEKKSMNKIKTLGFLGVMGLMGMMQSGCTDFLQLDPQDDIILEQFWTEKADVENVVTGCYTALQDAACIKRMIVWGEVRADNVGRGQNLSSGDGDLEKILKENIDAKNTYTNWDAFYNVINRCNTVIHYAPGVAVKDPSYTESQLRANIAEVTALRSLAYFYLIRAFRDVPYSSEAFIDDSQKMDLPATKFYDVLDSLIYSLEAVKGDAVNRYEETKPQYQTGRITKDGINAMLCEMYLWKKDYENCIKCADLVIESKKKIGEENRKLSSTYASSGGSGLFELTNGYPLVPSQDKGRTFGKDYEVLFGNDKENAEKNAQEIIFQLIFNDDPQGSGMSQNAAINDFYGHRSQKVGLLAPNDKVLEDVSSSDYEIFDKRNKKLDAREYENFSTTDKAITKYTTARMSIDATSTSSPVAKYDDRYTQNYNGSNWIIYRLSDVMLMKAEALTQLMSDGAEEEDIAYNKSLLDQAFTLVNAVNKRSLCKPQNELGADTLLRSDYNTKVLMDELVMKERRRELMFKGKRWFDLVRISQRAGNTRTLASAAGVACSSKGVSASEMVTNRLAKMDAIYWPYNYEEINVNKNLVQNPAFGSGEDKSYKNNY